MQRFNHYIITVLVGIVILGGVFVGGVTIGSKGNQAVASVELDQSKKVDLSSFWKTWDLLDEKFIGQETSSTTPTTTEAMKTEKRVWGAISGMVDSLGDPYTVFLPPKEKKNFDESIRGNFGGVGIELDLKDKIITVVTALDDTPAKTAGILPADKIIKINETEAVGLNIEQAISLIRGEIGTKVKLFITRKDELKPLEFNLTRAQITIPNIKTQLKDGVFIIRLSSFNANASNAFRKALREYVETKTDKLIIDLRGNPGGYLESAVDIASWFLPTGKPIVIERGRTKDTEKIHRSYGYNIFTDQLKIVLLVDGGSASASEILAGALSEYGKATLVGQKTFGKGSVQELVPVTEDSSLKVTIAKWYTPGGHSISDSGLTPEVLVERGKDDTKENDTQLNKAIEILKQKK